MIGPEGGRILVVDDDVANIEVLNEVLGSSYEVFFATRGAQAIEIARAALPDLVLLDVLMPEMNGYELCSRLRADPLTASIPVIFITGLGDVDAEIRGLEVGAVDYVTKPISPPLVRLRVRNQIELKRSRDRMEKLAETDGLTGLANRRAFDRVLGVEFRRLRRSGAPLSLILLDVDHFKLFNDHYGHVAGDDCLRSVAGVIGSAIARAADVAARYGGEEFGVVLPETSHEGAVLVAEKIRRAIVDACIPHETSPVASVVTASLGVVSVACAGLSAPPEVVAIADEQLYRAKSMGRNQIAGSDLTIQWRTTPGDSRARRPSPILT
ncbi:MAG TPA: diguanylate cyclase [Gemmatimonadaceae bacterium]|nr:diguanylate cyclase [Gemmatimonadaceae bacterium]